MTQTPQITEREMRAWFNSPVWQYLKLVFADSTRFCHGELSQKNLDQREADFIRGELHRLNAFLRLDTELPELYDSDRSAEQNENENEGDTYNG